MNHSLLHIAFLTSEYIIPPRKLDGGLAAYIQKTGRALAGRASRVSVFCCSDRNADWVDKGVNIHEVLCEPTLVLKGLSRIFLPAGEMESIFINASRLEKKLWQIHKDEPIDVIQAASYRAVGITLCGNGKIPLITRISSYQPLYRNANGMTNTLTTVLTDWCELYQVEHSQNAFAPSQLMAGYYRSFSKANPLVIRTPLDEFTRELDTSFYAERLEGKKYLLFFGSMNRMKGIEVISKVIGRIVEDFPNVHFAFAGRPQKDASGHFQPERLIRENNAYKGNIHYLASLPRAQLYPVIQNACGILLPSLADNYPNTCLEAMQFGKIVIGTRESSLDELIVDGQNGLLVNMNDAGSLEEGIRKLLGMPAEQIEAMESNVRDYSEKILAEDRIGQLFDFYEQTRHGFQPTHNRGKLRWERLLLLDKIKSNLWKVFLPGVGVKVVNKVNKIDDYEL